MKMRYSLPVFSKAFFGCNKEIADKSDKNSDYNNNSSPS